jgi:hypothetical protein
MSKPIGYSTIGPVPVPDPIKESFRTVCKEKNVHMEDQVVNCILKFVCDAHPELTDTLTPLVAARQGT